MTICLLPDEREHFYPINALLIAASYLWNNMYRTLLINLGKFRREGVKYVRRE